MNTTKILIVDDEPLIERLIYQRLRKEIQQDKYAFIFGKDGNEALNLIEQNQDIEIVITDINMPRIDGLKLIQKLHQTKPFLKIVMLSAYNDMKNIRSAMNFGAFDFLTKPLDFNDLKITLEKTIKEIKQSKQVKLNNELAVQNEKLEKISQLKKQFFTDITHEFRTPLSIISGISDQIEKKPEKWVSKGIPIIKRNTNELVNLVGNILDLRQLEVDKMKLDLKSTNIKSFIISIVETFKIYAESYQIKLHFINGLEDLNINIDQEKFKKILSNLLSNAIQSTPAGKNVYVISDIKNEQLRIQIKDSSQGIPKDQLPHLFNRFFQSDKEIHHGRVSAGVGLALAKEFTELMNGKIEVHSENKIGTTFIIHFPINQSPGM